MPVTKNIFLLLIPLFYTKIDYMEKYYHSYNVSYEKFTPDWFISDNQSAVDKYLLENTESMILFIESYFTQFGITKESIRGKEVLVTGCGFGGLCHYFAKLGAEVTGIDVSPLAIIGAKEIANNKGLYINFNTLDVCKDSIKQKFDFIFDDHLLHCLTKNSDRSAYYKFIHDHLTADGTFLIETMTIHSKFQTPVGFSLDEDYILWQQNIETSTESMIRKISPSIEIENEIKSSGLKICYLYYHAELAFQVYIDYPDFPFDYLPRTIRIATQRDNA